MVPLAQATKAGPWIQTLLCSSRTVRGAGGDVGAVDGVGVDAELGGDLGGMVEHVEQAARRMIWV